jgi:Fe-S cluster biogenesis protein NfuA
VFVTTPPDQQFHQRMQRVEGLLQEIESFPDARARETAREVVQALMDLHGAGLAAMLELLGAAGEPGRALIDAFARDGLIANLLLLYGLHPVDLNARVRVALETIRPTLRAGQGDVELLELSDGVVRVRLTASDDGSSTEALRTALQDAIVAAAPDVTAIEVEVALTAAAASRLIPLPLAGR